MGEGFHEILNGFFNTTATFLSFPWKRESRIHLGLNKTLDTRSPIHTFEDKFRGYDRLRLGILFLGAEDLFP
jgi:hypothetical protein